MARDKTSPYGEEVTFLFVARGPVPRDAMINPTPYVPREAVMKGQQ